MAMIVTACAGCADKLSDCYILTDIEEAKGKCPWCGRFFSSMTKYSCRPKARITRPQYKPRTGGGERNRGDDD